MEINAMNHYMAAALLLLAAVGVPLLWVAIGLPINTRNSGGDWWW